MDRILYDVLVGIVSNALTTIIASVGQKGFDVIAGKEILEKNRKYEKSLQPILKKAISELVENFEWNGDPQLEEVCLFLNSPNIEAVVRQIYASHLLSDESKKSVDDVKNEFISMFFAYFEVEKRKSIAAVESLFLLLLKSSEQALYTACDMGILAAHEAKSAFRHRIIMDELAVIEKNTEFISRKKRKDLKGFLEFEKKYREQVRDSHSTIAPPNFDTKRKFPIDKLYVSPHFISMPKKKGQEPTVLSKEALLSRLFRVVLLGTPGGGKSTFAESVTYELAKDYEMRHLSGRLVTPIVVVLREFAKEKKEKNCSILQFIETISNAKYQLPPPDGAFEYLLLNGRAVVIFDGLDELIDTSYRQEISSNIESFCNMYSGVPVIVTSREVGYEQAPLDETKFETFRLAPFEEKQTLEYINKWFDVDPDLTQAQKKEMAASFFQESRVVFDLCSNPLMLALMCNIYRGENYIPRNRPEVYEKCATMLFHRWDKSRNINVPLRIQIEAHITQAMMFLAHWIYSNNELQGGVNEKGLIEKAADYLESKRFEDRDAALEASASFIEFCRGRAWVFTDTGVAKDGEKLYQFTHRTFLEYFTAYHLVRIYYSPDRLGEIIFPRIFKQEWDVVAQLAFQLQNKNIEGAGDALLVNLIEQSKSHPDEDATWNGISFAVRCLGFLVPNPKIVREITGAVINKCLNWALSGAEKSRNLNDEDEYRKSLRAGELISNLLQATYENQVVLIDALQRLIVDKINDQTSAVSVFAQELGLHLRMNLYGHKDALVVADAVRSHVLQACAEKMRASYPCDFRAAFDAYRRRDILLSDVIRWHGLDIIFKDVPYRFYPNIFSWGIGLLLLDDFLDSLSENPKRKSSENDFSNLKYLGRLVATTPPPYLSKDANRANYFPYGDSEKKNPKYRDASTIDPEVVFGALVISAMILECLMTNANYKHGIKRMKASKIDFFKAWQPLFSARFEGGNVEQLTDLFEKYKFSSSDKKFLAEWATKEFDLVEPRPRKIHPKTVKQNF